MRLFDAHCHLQLPQYDADRVEVLARMQEADVGAIVIGTDYETSKSGLVLAQKHDFLWASVGLHPNDNEIEDFDMEKYQELAADPKVVAIGECGLDYFRSGKTAEERHAQMLRFEAQIQLALHSNKPLIIHCRDAHEDMLVTLGAHRRDHGERLKVVIHFFTGTRELAERYLDLGCFLSFPGPVTYTAMYDASIEACPMDKLLIETDSPFAAPVPHRGQRNEPVYVAEVAKKIAAIKGVSTEEIMTQTVKNASSVFRL